MEKRSVFLDIDGCFANFNPKMAALLRELYPELADVALPEHPSEAQTWFWSDHIPELTKEMEGHAWGALERRRQWWRDLDCLVTDAEAERMCDLQATYQFTWVTIRPDTGANADVREQTAGWLADHGLPHQWDVIIARGAKGLYVPSREPAFAIDDNGSQALSIAEAMLKCENPGLTYLLEYPYNEEYTYDLSIAGGRTVLTIDQFITKLEEAA